jgi:acetyl-CoA acetyltransferase
VKAKNTKSSRDPVIIGVGESVWVGEPAPGQPAKSSLHLHAEAALDAIRDAGIRKEDIDGVYTNESYLDYHVRHAMAFAEYFGIAASARMITSIPLGSGASSGLFVHYAARAILGGHCDIVLAVSADNFFSGLRRAGAVQALADNRDKEFEAPYGPTLPACFALVAQRYMHEFGTAPEQLAAVAVTMRSHAAATGRAHKRQPITIGDVLASKPVASPFTMLMCSLVSDGGAAVIITTRERAEHLRRPFIEILGMATAYGTDDGGRVHNSLSQTRDLLDIGTRRSARAAMTQAGISHGDVDILMTYDCFAIMPILFLEAAGFCKRGEGGAFFESGRAMLGGELPVNTHGGMMSYAHPGNPGGLFMFVELVRQLRGSLGDRQVRNAEVGMVTGYGGQMAFWPVTVLGRAR